MENRQTFGRRGAVQNHVRPVRVAAAASVSRPSVTSVDTDFEPARLAQASEAPSVEDELREWKRDRSVAFPWRPFYFMASICFGIASFVLPDSINDAVQWPLYALAAVSFYVGMKARREKRQPQSA